MSAQPLGSNKTPSLSPSPPKKQRLFWHSFIGITLGVIGGWLLLILFLPSPSQKTKGFRQKQQQIALPQQQTNTLLSQKPFSSLSVTQLYQKARKEARLGTFGKTFTWLHKNRLHFPLWHHLYWLLAQGSLQSNKPMNAATSFQNLAIQNTNQWSKETLLSYAAIAYKKAQKNRKARALLQKAMRYSPPQKKQKGWVWWQQERRATGKRLWLYAQFVGKRKKASAYYQLWTKYSDSKYALQAEKKWWGLWRRGYHKPSTKQYLKIASLYLSEYGRPYKARKILKQIKKRSLSRRKRDTYLSLWSRYYQSKGQLKRAFSYLQKRVKKRRKRRRARLYYRMIKQTLQIGSSRKLRKLLRKLKRRSKYWYARALFSTGLDEAKQGNSRYAKKMWRKAWKASRSHQIRSNIYFFRALLFLKKKRKAAKAKRELFDAAKQARKLSRRQKRNQPVQLFAYWYARSDERRGRRKRAIEQYRRIFAKVPLSFYGFLASLRLQRLGKLPPFPFVKARVPSVFWSVKTSNKALPEAVKILAQAGPASLYLGELESWAIRQTNIPFGLRIELAQLGNREPKQSHAFLWLHQKKRAFLRGKQPISRSLLIAAYPPPTKKWPKWIAIAKRYQLDTRLVAALLLHLRGFHPNTRRSQHIGPSSSPLWFPSPLYPPSSSFAASCRRLKKLLQRYRDPALAVEALLTQNERNVRHIKRTIPNQIKDIRYPFLSTETRSVLQTYWIYKLLYLQ